MVKLAPEETYFTETSSTNSSSNLTYEEQDETDDNTLKNEDSENQNGGPHGDELEESARRKRGNVARIREKFQRFHHPRGDKLEGDDVGAPIANQFLNTVDDYSKPRNNNNQFPTSYTANDWNSSNNSNFNLCSNLELRVPGGDRGKQLDANNNNNNNDSSAIESRNSLQQRNYSPLYFPNGNGVTNNGIPSFMTKKPSIPLNASLSKSLQINGMLPLPVPLFHNRNNAFEGTSDNFTVEKSKKPPSWAAMSITKERYTNNNNTKNSNIPPTFNFSNNFRSCSPSSVSTIGTTRTNHEDNPFNHVETNFSTGITNNNNNNNNSSPLMFGKTSIPAAASKMLPQQVTTSSTNSYGVPLKNFPETSVSAKNNIVKTSHNRLMQNDEDSTSNQSSDNLIRPQHCYGEHLVFDENVRNVTFPSKLECHPMTTTSLAFLRNGKTIINSESMFRDNDHTIRNFTETFSNEDITNPGGHAELIFPNNSNNNLRTQSDSYNKHLDERYFRKNEFLSQIGVLESRPILRKKKFNLEQDNDNHCNNNTETEDHNRVWERSSESSAGTGKDFCKTSASPLPPTNKVVLLTRHSFCSSLSSEADSSIRENSCSPNNKDHHLQTLGNVEDDNDEEDDELFLCPSNFEQVKQSSPLHSSLQSNSCPEDEEEDDEVDGKGETTTMSEDENNEISSIKNEGTESKIPNSNNFTPKVKFCNDPAQVFNTYSVFEYDRKNDEINPLLASAEYELEKRMECMDMITVELIKDELPLIKYLVNKKISARRLLKEFPFYNTEQQNFVPDNLKPESDETGLGISIVGLGIGTDIGLQKLGIFVKAITPGGAAEKDGRIQVYDQIIEVNHKCLVGVTQAFAAEVLSNARGTVRFTIGRETLENPKTPGITNCQQSFRSIIQKSLAAKVVEDAIAIEENNIGKTNQEKDLLLDNNNPSSSEYTDMSGRILAVPPTFESLENEITKLTKTPQSTHKNLTMKYPVVRISETAINYPSLKFADKKLLERLDGLEIKKNRFGMIQKPSKILAMKRSHECSDDNNDLNLNQTETNSKKLDQDVIDAKNEKSEDGFRSNVISIITKDNEELLSHPNGNLLHQHKVTTLRTLKNIGSFGKRQGVELLTQLKHNRDSFIHDFISATAAAHSSTTLPNRKDIKMKSKSDYDAKCVNDQTNELTKTQLQNEYGATEIDHSPKHALKNVSERNIDNTDNNLEQFNADLVFSKYETARKLINSYQIKHKHMLENFNEQNKQYKDMIKSLEYRVKDLESFIKVIPKEFVQSYDKKNDNLRNETTTHPKFNSTANNCRSNIKKFKFYVNNYPWKTEQDEIGNIKHANKRWKLFQRSTESVYSENSINSLDGDVTAENNLFDPDTSYMSQGKKFAELLNEKMVKIWRKKRFLVRKIAALNSATAVNFNILDDEMNLRESDSTDTKLQRRVKRVAEGLRPNSYPENGATLIENSPIGKNNVIRRRAEARKNGHAEEPAVVVERLSLNGDHLISDRKTTRQKVKEFRYSDVDDSKPAVKGTNHSEDSLTLDDSFFGHIESPTLDSFRLPRINLNDKSNTTSTPTFEKAAKNPLITGKLDVKKVSKTGDIVTKMIPPDGIIIPAVLEKKNEIKTNPKFEHDSTMIDINDQHDASRSSSVMPEGFKNFNLQEITDYFFNGAIMYSTTNTTPTPQGRVVLKNLHKEHEHTNDPPPLLSKNNSNGIHGNGEINGVLTANETYHKSKIVSHKSETHGRALLQQHQTLSDEISLEENSDKLLLLSLLDTSNTTTNFLDKNVIAKFNEVLPDTPPATVINNNRNDINNHNDTLNSQENVYFEDDFYAKIPDRNEQFDNQIEKIDLNTENIFNVVQMNDSLHAKSRHDSHDSLINTDETGLQFNSVDFSFTDEILKLLDKRLNQPTNVNPEEWPPAISCGTYDEINGNSFSQINYEYSIPEKNNHGAKIMPDPEYLDDATMKESSRDTQSPSFVQSNSNKVLPKSVLTSNTFKSSYITDQDKSILDKNNTQRNGMSIERLVNEVFPGNSCFLGSPLNYNMPHSHLSLLSKDSKTNEEVVRLTNKEYLASFWNAEKVFRKAQKKSSSPVELMAQ